MWTLRIKTQATVIWYQTWNVLSSWLLNLVVYSSRLSELVLNHGQHKRLGIRKITHCQTRPLTKLLQPPDAKGSPNTHINLEHSVANHNLFGSCSLDMRPCLRCSSDGALCTINITASNSKFFHKFPFPVGWTVWDPEDLCYCVIFSHSYYLMSWFV